MGGKENLAVDQPRFLALRFRLLPNPFQRKQVMSPSSMLLAVFLLHFGQIGKQAPSVSTCLLDEDVRPSSSFLSRDGKHIVIAGGSQKGGDWKIIDLTTGKCFVNGLTGTIRCQAASEVCLSNDNSMMALCGGTRLFLVEFATGKLLWDLTKEGYNPGRNGEINHVCFTPDNKFLVSILGADKMIRIWDIENRKAHSVIQFIDQELNPADRRTVERGEKAKVFHYIIGDSKRISGSALSPDGKTLALAGCLEGKIPFVDLSAGKIVATINLKQRTSVSLQFTPDAKWLMVGGSQEKGMIEIWDIEKAKLIAFFGKHDGPICHLAISPDKKSVVSGGSGDGFRVWDVATGKQKFSYFTKDDPRMPRVKIDPDSLQRYVENGASAGVAFLPDGKNFLIIPHWTMWNTEIYFHDTATGLPVDYRQAARRLPETQKGKAPQP